MAIDICITTYHSAIKLAKCLESILLHTNDVEYNILLWCNDIDADAKKMIEEAVQKNNRIKSIFNPTNSGSFAANNNLCAAQGHAEYILFLNDDCYAQKDCWLSGMENILKTDEKVGSVGALLLYPDGKTIQHCGVFFSSRTNNLPYHMHYKQSLDKVKNFIQVPRYYQACTGAALLVRRKDFEAIGGFCEEYKYSFEDVQLCLDIGNKLKKQCVFCPDAVLIHDEGISKTQPHLKHNVGVFKKNCTGRYYNDLEFYLSNSKYMIYKKKY